MTAKEVIIKAMQAGTLLYAETGKLRYKARVSLPPDLAEQLKTHRSEVLRLLSVADTTPVDVDTTHKNPQENNPSVNVNGVNTGPDYTNYEREVLRAAGVEPGSLPLLDEVKAAFPDSEVLSVEPEPVDNPRRATARLIREARRHDPERAIAIRDAWHERVERCVVDGHQSEAQAERIALAEIAGTEPPADPDAMIPAERGRWIRNTAAGTRWHERQCEQLPI